MNVAAQKRSLKQRPTSERRMEMFEKTNVCEISENALEQKARRAAKRGNEARPGFLPPHGEVL